MQLWEMRQEDCVIMDKTTVPDGSGGVITTWTEGAPFKAAIVPSGTQAQLVALQKGWKGSYDVTTTKSIVFYAGDIFKRVSDGKTFRVTEDGRDNYTPESASLNMRKVSAEEYGYHG